MGQWRNTRPGRCCWRGREFTLLGHATFGAPCGAQARVRDPSDCGDSRFLTLRVRLCPVNLAVHRWTRIEFGMTLWLFRSDVASRAQASHTLNPAYWGTRGHFKSKDLELLLFGAEGVEGQGEARFVAVRCVFGENLAANGAVDFGEGGADQPFGGGDIAGGQRCAKFADRSAHSGAIDAIGGRTRHSLTHVLQDGFALLAVLYGCSLRHSLLLV